MENTNEIWANFLNPDILRRRFMVAGMYMIAHEMLVDTIVGRTRDLFSYRWSVEKGWETSERYKQLVLSLDPTGKSNALRASLRWLENEGALSADDCRKFRELTDARNRFAHELSRYVASGKGPNFETLFPMLSALLLKLENWWIYNVELATDPDIDLEAIDREGIVSGKKLILDCISSIALGDDEQAWELYNMFIAAESEA